MGYVKVYLGRSNIDVFVLITDHKHLALVVECIANSAPISELVDILLHFNLWQVDLPQSQYWNTWQVDVPRSKYKISTQGPIFLGWLEEQVTPLTGSMIYHGYVIR